MKNVLNNRQKFLVYFIILLILGFSLTAGFIWLLRPRYWEYDTSINTKDIHLFGDQKQYVLVPFQARVIQNYIYTIRFRRLTEDEDTHTIQDGEYLEVDLYDLRTKNFRKKTIDLYQLDLGKDYQSYMIKHVNSISGIHYQDKDYLLLQLTPYGKSKKRTKNVLFNLDTEKIEEITPDVEVFLGGRRLAEDLLSSVTNDVFVNEKTKKEFHDSLAYHLRQTYNLDTHDIYNSYVLSSTHLKNKDQIPKNIEQVNFSDLYPEMVKKLTVKNIQIVGREGMVDRETWFNTLVHWFAPKGQERLELYAMRYDFSTKPPTELYKTPVSSYAEVKAWLEAHPEEE